MSFIPCSKIFKILFFPSSITDQIQAYADAIAKIDGSLSGEAKVKAVASAIASVTANGGANCAGGYRTNLFCVSNSNSNIYSCI